MKKQQLGPRQLRLVEALESGKYRQCTGRIRDTSGALCVVGVARELLLNDQPMALAELGSLSPVLKRYYRFRDDDVDGHLITLNDRYKWSFKDFAKAFRLEPFFYFSEEK